MCSVAGCESKAHALGLCTKHYQRIKKYGTLDPQRCSDGTPEERFWRFVDKRDSDQCWNWVGVKSNNGRGRLKVSYKYVTAYRFSYELHNGCIPIGALVLHSCDNPSCVNPSHLFTGTQKDNLADRESKGRRLTWAGNDSPLKKITDEEVCEIRSSSLSNRSIADKFGVSESLISAIRLNKRRIAKSTTPQIRGLG